MRDPDFRERAPEMVRDGKTISQIGNEFDLSWDATRSRLRRMGLRATRRDFQTVREIAEDMKPLDAVNYLLQVVEQLELVCPSDHPVDHFGVHLSGVERRLLVALIDAAERPVSVDGLFAAMYFDRLADDDIPGPNILKVYICRIRRKLSERLGAIGTVCSVGYVFHRGPDFPVCEVAL